MRPRAALTSSPGVSPLHPSTAEGRGSGRRGSSFHPPPPAMGWGSGFGALQAAPLRSLSSSSGQAMTRQKGLGEVGVWAAAAAARAGGGAAGNPAGVRGG